jgi:sugar/nucleoside kinase (ribokinase family)
MLIVTLGDVLLDVIVRLDEPLATGADANAATQTGAGGQAANVAAWVVELGGEARCVARRGEDQAGVWLGAELAGRGVALVGPVAGRNGVVVSIVGPNGERTLASDRGTATLLEPSDLDPDWFACDCLHISGYALVSSPIDTAAGRAAQLAHAQGARVSVDLSAWTRIRAHGAARFRAQLEALEPDVLFGNEGEWDEVGPFWGTGVVKRGAQGIEIVRGDLVEMCQAPETSVMDTTGAGDALAAGFLVGGAELALEAAARCVAQVGAMP